MVTLWWKLFTDYRSLATINTRYPVSSCTSPGCETIALITAKQSNQLRQKKMHRQVNQTSRDKQYVKQTRSIKSYIAQRNPLFFMYLYGTTSASTTTDCSFSITKKRRKFAPQARHASCTHANQLCANLRQQRDVCLGASVLV